MKSKNQRQRQIEDEKEEALQPKPLADSISRTINPDLSVAKVTPETASRISSMKGAGQPLPTSEQSFFGSRFGADFSGVKVQTGINAAELADNIRAKAFTTGNDIFFNQGQYSPESYEGKKLLVHELTHTIQQNGVQAKKMIQRKKKTKNKQKKISEYEIFRISENRSWLNRNNWRSGEAYKVWKIALSMIVFHSNLSEKIRNKAKNEFLAYPKRIDAYFSILVYYAQQTLDITATGILDDNTYENIKKVYIDSWKRLNKCKGGKIYRGLLREYTVADYHRNWLEKHNFSLEKYIKLVNRIYEVTGLWHAPTKIYRQRAIYRIKKYQRISDYNLFYFSVLIKEYSRALNSMGAKVLPHNRIYDSIWKKIVQDSEHYKLVSYLKKKSKTTDDQRKLTRTEANQKWLSKWKSTSYIDWLDCIYKIAIIGRSKSKISDYKDYYNKAKARINNQRIKGKDKIGKNFSALVYLAEEYLRNVNHHPNISVDGRLNGYTFNAIKKEVKNNSKINFSYNWVDYIEKQTVSFSKSQHENEEKSAYDKIEVNGFYHMTITFKLMKFLIIGSHKKFHKLHEAIEKLLSDISNYRLLHLRVFVKSKLGNNKVAIFIKEYNIHTVVDARSIIYKAKSMTKEELMELKKINHFYKKNSFGKYKQEIKARKKLLKKLGFLHYRYEDNPSNFKSEFADYALGKAYFMLKYNKKINDKELKRYSNDDKLKALLKKFHTTLGLEKDRLQQYTVAYMKKHMFSKEDYKNYPILASSKFLAKFNWFNYHNSYEIQMRDGLKKLTYMELYDNSLKEPRNAIKKIINDSNSAIASLRKKLGKRTIWKLPKVIELAMIDLKINKNSVLGKLIHDELNKKDWSEELLTALSIALAIIAMFGPQVLAAIATGGSLLLAGRDLKKEKDKYDLKNAAYNSALNPENAVASEEPSLLWVALAAAGFLLDAGDAIKLVRALKRLKPHELKELTEVQKAVKGSGINKQTNIEKLSERIVGDAKILQTRYDKIVKKNRDLVTIVRNKFKNKYAEIPFDANGLQGLVNLAGYNRQVFHKVLNIKNTNIRTIVAQLSESPEAARGVAKLYHTLRKSGKSKLFEHILKNTNLQKELPELGRMSRSKVEKFARKKAGNYWNQVKKKKSRLKEPTNPITYSAGQSYKIVLKNRVNIRKAINHGKIWKGFPKGFDRTRGIKGAHEKTIFENMRSHPEISKRVDFEKLAYQDKYWLYRYRYWKMDGKGNRVIPNEFNNLTKEKPFYKSVYSGSRWSDKKMTKMAVEAFKNSLLKGTNRLGRSKEAWYGKAKNGNYLGGYHDSNLNITTIFFVFKEHLYTLTNK